MDENEPDNVVSLLDRIDPNADIDSMKNFIQKPVPDNVKYCQHLGVIVDEFERNVTCRRCGKALDPFDYLLSVAKKETRVDWDLRQLREEIKRHRSVLESMQREEVNCRGRIRNAQFKLMDINNEISQLADQLLKEKGHG